MVVAIDRRRRCGSGVALGEGGLENDTRSYVGDGTGRVADRRRAGRDHYRRIIADRRRAGADAPDRDTMVIADNVALGIDRSAAALVAADEDGGAVRAGFGLGGKAEKGESGQAEC